MSRTRTVIFSVVGILFVLSLAWVLSAAHSIRREKATIRARYQQMRATLSLGNNNAAAGLIAPLYRGGFDGRQFSMLNDFATPLGPDSSIFVFRDKAVVWPSHTSHYVVLPGGNTIEMIKSGGSWFFTGKVNID